MRPCFALWALMFCCAINARAEDYPPTEAVVAKVKNATVFVRVETLKAKGSGSGFVVGAGKDTALIATNYHVVAGSNFDPKATPTPSDVRRFLKEPTITVVFDSGTKSERSFKATAVAGDAANDLAILRVEGVKDAPAPVSYADTPKLVETMPVFVFGFPFGQSLSFGKGNPAITVGKGAVSSIRNNDEGEVALVQIDGSVNPGNSGGPIVDAKGRLVGVAVATIRGSGIGLAVPALELGRLMKGRYGEPRLSPVKTAEGKVSVSVEVAIMDPANSLEGADLHYLIVPTEADKPKAGMRLDRIGGAAKATLKVVDGVGKADFVLDKAEGVLVAQVIRAGGEDERLSGVRIARLTELRGSISNPFPKIGGNPKLNPKVVVSKNDGDVTAVLGFGFDPLFKEVGPDGSTLVGLEVTTGKFLNNDVLKAVRPIYRKGETDSPGELHGLNLPNNVIKVVAKPGYALAGVTVKTGLGVDGLSVTFAKLADGKLDLSETYESDWIGGMGGGRPTTVKSDGRPIVGLLGRTSPMRMDELTGIGLQMAPKK